MPSCICAAQHHYALHSRVFWFQLRKFVRNVLKISVHRLRMDDLICYNNKSICYWVWKLKNSHDNVHIFCSMSLIQIKSYIYKFYVQKKKNCSYIPIYLLILTQIQGNMTNMQLLNIFLIILTKWLIKIWLKIFFIEIQFFLW